MDHLEDDTGLIEVVQVRGEARVNVGDDKGHSLVWEGDDDDQLLRKKRRKMTSSCKKTCTWLRRKGTSPLTPSSNSWLPRVIASKFRRLLNLHCRTFNFWSLLVGRLLSYIL